MAVLRHVHAMDKQLRVGGTRASQGIDVLAAIAEQQLQYKRHDRATCASASVKKVLELEKLFGPVLQHFFSRQRRRSAPFCDTCALSSRVPLIVHLHWHTSKAPTLFHQRVVELTYGDEPAPIKVLADEVVG